MTARIDPREAARIAAQALRTARAAEVAAADAALRAGGLLALALTQDARAARAAIEAEGLALGPAVALARLSQTSATPERVVGLGGVRAALRVVAGGLRERAERARARREADRGDLDASEGSA